MRREEIMEEGKGTWKRLEGKTVRKREKRKQKV